MSVPPIRRSPTHSAQVVATGELTPRMRRVTLHADSMVNVLVRPAQDVELLLRESSGRRVKRRYTIRAARPEVGELDLDVLLHGEGPGAIWAAAATAGDAVDFQGPRGKLDLRPATWHLLVGDESALPAVSVVCAALPAHEPAIALVEVGGSTDELPIEQAHVRWVHRAHAAPGGAESLRAALAALRLPVGNGRAYLMGETRAMVTLRAELETRGVPHDSIFVKGYWNLGRPDRLAGRTPPTS